MACLSLDGGALTRPFNWSGFFNCPLVVLDINYSYQLNSQDSFDLAWTTYTANTSEAILGFYAWFPTAGVDNPRDHSILVPGTERPVKQNGTLNYSFSANPVAGADSQQYYVGWWRVTYGTGSGNNDTVWSPSVMVHSNDTQSPMHYSIAGVTVANSTQQVTDPTTTAGPTSTSNNHAASSNAGQLSSDSSAGAGLSSGEVAGIAIGVIALVGLFAALAAFLWMRSRRSRSGNSGFNNDSAAMTRQPSIQKAYANPFQDPRHEFEAHSARMYELSPTAIQTELPSGHTTQELPVH